MKVLAFEDSVDIEALLISGGVDLEDVDFKNFLSAQPWCAPNFLGKKPTGFKFLISTTDH